MTVDWEERVTVEWEESDGGVGGVTVEWEK